MTGVRGVLIPADHSKPAQIVMVDAGQVPAALGFQWMEVVRTQWLRDRRLLMVVDEEGRLNGSAVNVRASRIYGAWIAGDVLIVADGGEDFQSLHPAQVGQIVGLDFLDSTPSGEEARS